MKKQQTKQQENYTIADIKEFLKNQLNLKWDGEVYDSKIEQYRTAFIGDLGCASIRFQQINAEKDAVSQTLYYARISVDNSKFKYTFAMQETDLSKQWQNFLAQKENNLNV